MLAKRVFPEHGDVAPHAAQERIAKHIEVSVGRSVHGLKDIAKELVHVVFVLQHAEETKATEAIDGFPIPHGVGVEAPARRLHEYRIRGEILQEPSRLSQVEGVAHLLARQRPPPLTS